MKNLTILSLLFLFLPFFASAQGNLQTMIAATVGFFNTVIIPVLLGIGFLILVINVFRFFILEGTNQDGREKAKALALYAVMGMVLIVILWGLVNILVSSIGLGGYDMPQNDYVELEGGTVPTTP